MAVKYFCDKCGSECKSNVSVIPIYARDTLGTKLMFLRNNILCDECAKKFNSVKDRLKCVECFFDMTDDDISLMEYDFKVGDIVVTDTGEVGFIESICDCDRCKERGFYEPRAKTIDGDDIIYITDNSKNNGFANFYQIGKYKFGNLDKESVITSIGYINKDIKEATERLKRYKKQLHHISMLEILERKNKDFLVNVNANGFLYSPDFDEEP